MKRFMPISVAIGIIVLLLSSLSLGLTGADWAMQATVTPTVIIYLPLVAKDYPPAPAYAILNSEYTAKLFRDNGWEDYPIEHVVPATEMMDELPPSYSYELITDAQVERGVLMAKRYKALIVPEATSMSDKECAAICDFVRNGGLLFTTAGTSWYQPGNGWRPKPPAWGLNCLGVSYSAYDEGYVWNMDIVTPCSPLLKGVFEKSDSGGDIAISGGDFLAVAGGGTATVTTQWKDTHYVRRVPGLTENRYASGRVVYVTGELFQGWKQSKDNPVWGSRDNEPCQNAEKLLWNALYSYAPTPISNLKLSHWWLQSQMREQTGLIDSYENGNGQYATDQAYTYDQALAIIAFSLLGDYSNARVILDALSTIQNDDGSFYFAYSATSYAGYSSKRPVGTNAWVVMAINYYTSLTGDSSYIPMARKCADWFLQYQDIDGGIRGGVDENENEYIWKSTEHNEDAYSALTHLYSLTGVEEYHTNAEEVKAWLEVEMWNSCPGAPRFARGEQGDGSLDCYPAMDVNPWGVLALGTTGPSGEDYLQGLDWAYQNSANTRDWDGWNAQCAPVSNVEGFDFNDDEDAVWVEGTESMAVALMVSDYSLASKSGAYFHNQMAKLHGVTGDGGLPYSTNEGTVDEGDEKSATYSSVAATTWYIFAEKQFNPFKMEVARRVFPSLTIK
jgi:hypothetical protein